MKKLRISIFALALHCAPLAFAQVVHIPGGTSGIGSISGNNVGIGTDNPSERLHVMGNMLLGSGYPNNYLIRLRTASNWDYYLAPTDDDFKIYDSQATTFLWFRYSGGGGNKHAILAGTLYAYNGGNVGIGTDSPSHKLSVNGAVRAKEIIVDSGWADHVFADDYRLAPLAEVDAHIREMRRLPGIPSAAEVAKNGISVGDMQAKLLEKIEELTLHVIRQDREIASQRAMLAAQNAEISAIKNGRKVETTGAVQTLPCANDCELCRRQDTPRTDANAILPPHCEP